MAGAPARTFGLSDRKGAIAPGMDADLVVVDMDRTETLGAERLLSRGKVSVYEGWEVTGVPVMTFVRGAGGEDGAIADDTPAGAWCARICPHPRRATPPPRCRPSSGPETCRGTSTPPADRHAHPPATSVSNLERNGPVQRGLLRHSQTGLLIREAFGFRPETTPRFRHFLSAKKDHSTA
jgi:hypothetical protein